MPRIMPTSITSQGTKASAGFLDGMRLMANSVAIIAASVDGERRGLTVTAVCSLSADPPMLAVCVNKSSSAYATIQAASRFTVNCLSTKQTAIAKAFSGGLPAVDRFQQGDWRVTETGVPVLGGAVATFECELASTLDVATHTLFIGLVEKVSHCLDEEPLIYHDRRYKHAANSETTPGD